MLGRTQVSHGKKEEGKSVTVQNRGNRLVDGGGATLLFLESEERSSLWLVLLLGARRQGPALVRLGLLRSRLSVDAVDPKVHLVIISCLEQVVATVGQSATSNGQPFPDCATYLSLKTYFFLV